MNHKTKLIFSRVGFIVGIPLLLTISFFIGTFDFANHYFFMSILLAFVVLIISFFCPSFGIAALIFVLPLEFFYTHQATFALSLYHLILPPVFIGVCFNSICIKKKPFFRKSKIDFYIILFVLLVIISSLKSFSIPNAVPVFGQKVYNLPFARGLTRIFVLLHSIMLCYLIFWVIDSRKRLEQILLWLFASGALVSLVGLLGWLGDRFRIFSIKGFLIAPALGPVRINSTFAEPITLGIYLILLFPTIIFIFLSKNKFLTFLSKLKWFFLIFIISITLFLTFSRAAWLGLFGIICFYVLFGKLFISNKGEYLVYMKERKLLICGIVLLLIITLIFSPTILLKIFEKIKNAVNPDNPLQFWSTKSRLILLYSAFDIFLQNPILGIGYENFAFYFFKAMPDLGHMSLVNLTETNNLLMKILLELGLIGLLVAGLFSISFMLTLLKTIRKVQNPFYKAVLVGGLLSMVGLFFQYQFISRIPIPIVWLFLGILISTIYLAEKEETFKNHLEIIQ